MAQSSKAVSWTPKFSFAASPAIGDFLVDDSPVRIIIGPIGSGKTLACCFEILRRALRQHAGPDGIRYFKAAVVRNTVPELKTTTLETWTAVFPPSKIGRFIKTSPMYHQINMPSNNWVPGLAPERQAPNAEPGLNLRVDFFGLDNDQDLARLMSYEATLFFFNELRFIPRKIFKTATDRVGRYPSIQKGGTFPTWEGVIADTNPPDKDHWIFDIEHEEHPPEGWKVWHQPPGVLEAEQIIEIDGMKAWKSKETGYPDAITRHESQVAFSAKRFWIANPHAENLFWINKHDPETGEYLLDPLGRRGHYLKKVAGAPLDWIKVMYQGYYGALKEGKPVIEEFDRDTMVDRSIEPLAHIPLIAGMDVGAGTLNPAIVFGQRTMKGRWLIHDEIAGIELGLIRFCEEIKAKLPWMTKKTVMGDIWGDPAGEVRDGVTEQAYFWHFKKNGIYAMACQTNDIQVRIDAMKAPMGRMIDKRPGILIHPRCTMLIKALESQWQFRRTQVKGVEKFMQTPDKSDFSHVAEALGYMLLGGGEGRALVRDPNRTFETVTANSEFDVW